MIEFAYELEHWLLIVLCFIIMIKTFQIDSRLRDVGYVHINFSKDYEVEE